MPLKQHEFYVYHEDNFVYARAGDRERVVAEEFETPQEAHDRVQAILNPEGLIHHQVDPRLGFGHESFQSRISPRCERYVRAAYANANIDPDTDPETDGGPDDDIPAGD